ncbi:MFS transporter [Kitasatospora sp. NPDC057223]|uniref:MFS transporter n=1 Tax=Kitasatospora sp. NPDC057223 TaxID=3346055 RepID=UPI00363C8C47
MIVPYLSSRPLKGSAVRGRGPPSRKVHGDDSSEFHHSPARNSAEHIGEPVRKYPGRFRQLWAVRFPPGGRAGRHRLTRGCDQARTGRSAADDACPGAPENHGGERVVTTSGPVHRRRRPALAVLSAVLIVAVMDNTIMNVALRTIQHDLGASNADLQWCLDSYIVAFAAFLFTGGVSADRFGRRRTLTAGLLVFGGASLLAAFAGSAGELIAARALMGVGAAVIPTTTLAIIINIFPAQERARAIGAWATAAGVAIAVGPITGGLLLGRFWWGSIFLVNVPLVIGSVLLIGRLVPESRNPANSRFDPAGVVVSVLAIGALVFGVITGGERGDWLSAGAVVPVVLGIALLGLLVVVERRIAAPALDVGLFRSARFSAGTGSIALAFFAMMGALFVLTFYFQLVHGYSPMESGLLMVPMAAGSVFLANRSVVLAARFGVRNVVAGGATAMALTFLGYLAAEPDTPVLVLAGLQLLFGLGFGSIMAPGTAALMSVVPPEKAGAGQAVSQTVRQVATALGVAAVGSVLTSVYRSSLGDAVDALPAGLREQAAGSIGGAFRALEAAPGSAPRLAGQAVAAYQDSMHVTMALTAAVALLAAVVALRWLPGRATAAATAVTAEAAARTPAPAGAAG